MGLLGGPTAGAALIVGILALGAGTLGAISSALTKLGEARALNAVREAQVEQLAEAAVERERDFQNVERVREDLRAHSEARSAVPVPPAREGEDVCPAGCRLP